MHCPQCGQLQVSSEMRFCSRCGFPMGGVAELLARGGVLQAGGDELREEALSPRYVGVRQGVVLLLLGAIIVPILGIITSYQESSAFLEILVAVSAVIFFAGGLMRILYAALFEKGASNTRPFAPEAVAPPPTNEPLRVAAARPSALPPAPGTPVNDFVPRRPNTAEMVRPPSVTENTTRLLDEDRAPRSE